MTIERMVGLCFCVVLTSEAAAGQPPNETTAQGQKAPARTVVQRTHAAGDVLPWRRVQTRSESGSREVVLETFEEPDFEGRLAPTLEIVVETNRVAPTTAQSRRDLLRVGPDGRRTLVETTASLRETLANGDTRAIHNTSAPDLNGRLSVTSRQIEQTWSATPNVREAHTTLLVPDVNETLRATERIEHSERRINPGLVRHDSTQLVRDINGRWQPIEVRRGEARETGASDRLEEETIERRDMNGRLVVDEKNVIRRSNANGQEHVVIETYAPYADGLPRLALRQRVDRTTTATADGGRYTVEEVQSRSYSAPSDPVRVTRRTVTTVRHTGTDRWETQRQVFERDVNGRLRLVVNETEESAGG